jgi:kinesin family protein 18/19
MLGTEEKPGIMFQTLKELFNKMHDYKIDKEFNIRVSFLEIYNEQIRDLIMVSSDVLDLREDPVKGVCVAGLSEIEVDTPEEVLDLLMYDYKYKLMFNFSFGNRNRTQEATGANETSSRSHAVL